MAVQTAAFAQFKLNGKITHYTGGADVRINIPVVCGFFDQNSIRIPVTKDGSFSITLPIKSQKFGHLFFNADNYPLLLNSNKTLTVNLDANTKGLKFITGSALPENTLLHSTNPSEYPIFLQDDKYTRLDLNALNIQLLKPYLAARDRKIALVNKSTVSAADKKMIAAELRYIAYNYLHELTDLSAENPAALNKLVADIYSKAPIKPEVMPAGPQYYIFVNNYLQEAEKRTTGKQNLLTGRWQSAVKYLTADIAQQFGYQLITRAFYNGDPAQTKALISAYLQKFPTGVYTADVRKKALSFR